MSTKQCGDNFTIYTYIESLCCILGSNIVCVNYISIKIIDYLSKRVSHIVGGEGYSFYLLYLHRFFDSMSTLRESKIKSCPFYSIRNDGEEEEATMKKSILCIYYDFSFLWITLYIGQHVRYK